METVTKVLIKMRPLSTDGAIVILEFDVMPKYEWARPHISFGMTKTQDSLHDGVQNKIQENDHLCCISRL